MRRKSLLSYSGILERERKRNDDFSLTALP